MDYDPATSQGTPKSDEKPGRNTWTVMVYLAGDNNLAEEMVYALKCMQLVGSSPPHYEVFALYDAGIVPTTLRIRARHDPPVGLLKQAEQAALSQAREKERSSAAQLTQATTIEQRIKADMDLEGLDDSSARKTQQAGAAARKIASMLLNKKGVQKSEIEKTVAEEMAAEMERKTRHDKSDARHRDAIAMRSEAETRHSRAKAFLDGLEKRNSFELPEIVDSVRRALTDFVVNTIREHPAEHYMLVLSGHGSGAVGDFLTSNKRFVGLSIPDLRDAMQEVQEALKAGTGGYEECFKRGKLDILGMDSCLMGMAEVAYEVRHYVDYLVGAEGFEPNTGWPYDLILNRVRLEPDILPEELARGIVEEYISYYASDYTLAGVSTDLTALDLREIDGASNIEPLAGALGELSSAMESGLTKPGLRDAVLLAHWRAQGYKNEQHTDLWDFCELLRNAAPPDSDIAKACVTVQSAVAKVVFCCGYCGPAFQHSHGVSIFFPWANITDAAGVRELAHYNTSLEFADKTGWQRFLAAYHKTTQREPRPGADGPHVSTLNRREGLFTGEPGKTGTPGNTRAGGVGGSDGNGRSGTPGNTRAGTPGTTRTGTPGNTRMEGLPRIASMKNPPIQWFDQ